jgi:hypothetical protein
MSVADAAKGFLAAVGAVSTAPKPTLPPRTLRPKPDPTQAPSWVRAHASPRRKRSLRVEKLSERSFKIRHFLTGVLHRTHAASCPANRANRERTLTHRGLGVHATESEH